MHRKITDVWPNLLVPGQYIQEAVAEIDDQVPEVELIGDAALQENNV